MAMVADQITKLVQRDEDAVELAGEGGKPIHRSPHIMMAGPAGTGKTTVANAMAAIYKDLGVIPTDKLVAIHASDISGRFRGEAADNMMQAAKSAKGGVLFIDEAHQLADDKYGKQALRALIKPMADPDFNTVVIFAGYSKELPKLFKVDEGLRSRVPTTLKFNAFSGDQMTEYADKRLAETMGRKFANDDAYDAMGDALDEIAESGDHASMRDVNSFLDYADDARISRLAGKKLPAKKRAQLTSEDFRTALTTFKNRDVAA